MTPSNVPSALLLASLALGGLIGFCAPFPRLSRFRRGLKYLALIFLLLGVAGLAWVLLGRGFV